MRDPKMELHHYLAELRQALVWKLDGVSEYDVRRPLTPTGTNLLGLVKHVTLVEQGYLGLIFGRTSPDMPSLDEVMEVPNSDMWATADESRDHIMEMYQRAWQHADETIGALELDSPGIVPWWSEANQNVTLHRILLHVITDTARHVGHADIVRETIDGAAGMMPGNDNLPPLDVEGWTAHVAQVEAAARTAGGVTE